MSGTAGNKHAHREDKGGVKFQLMGAKAADTAAEAGAVALSTGPGYILSH